MPGPKPQAVVVAREEREKLEQIERAATSEQRAALRARIVLRAADGFGIERTARELRVTDDTVRKWRQRFLAHGLEGLGDLPRSGRPTRFDGVVRCQVISLACRPVPEEFCRNEWARVSLRRSLLDAELVDDISTSTMGRILSEADFRPHRYRMWVHSPDPLFTVKVREVVDLYVSAADADTAVLCIDEKTGMQALERRFPGRPPSPGEEGRWEFEYRRHGTQCLTAALNVHTGQVVGRCTPTRTKADLISFMDEVVAPAYPTQLIHVVWDNLNTHHGAHWNDFNRRHGERFRFHSTPIHASWCNQVEIWFSILARRVLRRASFRDVSELVTRVMAFIELWNRSERKPFRWTFKGYPVQSGLELKETAWPRTSSRKPLPAGSEPSSTLNLGTSISKSRVVVATSLC